MSETTETTAPVAQLPPGITMIKKSEAANGAQAEFTLVTFGSTPPRTIEVVDLDLGAQFDLAEVTGGSDNLEYRNMAFVAASVRSIDGHPAMSFGNGMISKRSLRETLKQLRREGLMAATAAIRTFSAVDAEPDLKAAAGNS